MLLSRASAIYLRSHISGTLCWHRVLRVHQESHGAFDCGHKLIPYCCAFRQPGKKNPPQDSRAYSDLLSHQKRCNERNLKRGVVGACKHERHRRVTSLERNNHAGLASKWRHLGETVCVTHLCSINAISMINYNNCFPVVGLSICWLYSKTKTKQKVLRWPSTNVFQRTFCNFNFRKRSVDLLFMFLRLLLEKQSKTKKNLYTRLYRYKELNKGIFTLM